MSSYDTFLYLASLFIRTHLSLVVLAGVIYTLEVLTGKINFFQAFSKKKNNENEVRGLALFYSTLYFSFLLFFLLVEHFLLKRAPKDLPFGTWLYVALFLTLIFWNIYFGYHKKWLSKL